MHIVVASLDIAKVEIELAALETRGEEGVVEGHNNVKVLERVKRLAQLRLRNGAVKVRQVIRRVGR